MKRSDIEKADKKLNMKVAAMGILKRDGLHNGIIDSKTRSELIKTITDGDSEYCEVHGHMKHNKHDFCILCSKKVA